PLRLPVGRLEITLPKRFEQLQLSCDRLKLSLCVLVTGQLEIGRPALAVNREERLSVLLETGQRILELPFGPGNGLAPIDRTLIAVLGQRSPESRPHDHDKQIASRRAIDVVLEMRMRQHWLAFPEYGGEIEEPLEFTFEAAHDD